MTPRLQHLLDLVEALERRLDAPRDTADEWLFTADLFGRVAAFDPAERAEAGLADRWRALSIRRPALETALDRALPAAPFLPILERAEAIADGEPLDGETDLAWGMDAACLAGAFPLLQDAAREAARRILRDCRTTVAVSPEEFPSLPELAARRVEDECPRSQPELWALLETFGEVNLIPAGLPTATATADLAVVRSVLARGGERIGLSPRAWSEDIEAAEDAVSPKAVVIPFVAHSGPWASASAPRLRRSEVPVVRLSLRASPMRAAADAGTATPSVPPEAWLVLHADDAIAVRVTEVAPRGDSGSQVLLSVVAMPNTGPDLRASGSIQLLRHDHPVSASVVRRTAREWEAVILETGPLTVVVGDRRIAFELSRGDA